MFKKLFFDCQKVYLHNNLFRGNSGMSNDGGTDELKPRNLIETTERDYLYSRCIFRHLVFEAFIGYNL